VLGLDDLEERLFVPGSRLRHEHPH